MTLRMAARWHSTHRTTRILLALAFLGTGPVLSTSIAPSSAQAQSRVLTLEEALGHARAHAPELMQAKSSTQAARARADQARAPLFPQVRGSVRYERATANRPPGRSTVGGSSQPASFDSYNAFSFGVDAEQLIYDFGQTSGRLEASEARADAEADLERSRMLDVELDVRTTYYEAAAAKALVAVANETLANEERHLHQIQGFVEVGTRPPIDLAQAKTDVANTRLSQLRADNAYRVAKAELDRAMGMPGASGEKGDYDVSDAEPEPLAGEDSDIETLLNEARKNRPDHDELAHQLRAQEASVAAAEAEYGPSLGAAAGVRESGQDPGDMRWNWNVAVALTWPLYQGGATQARVREAKATLANVRAQIDARDQQTRLELTRARLQIVAARAAQDASAEVVKNARERLTLAEGRYQTGVGNSVELGDAQLALTDAQAESVRANYDLAKARAALVHALGRR
jgi:outer membrane protein